MKSRAVTLSVVLLLLIGCQANEESLTDYIVKVSDSARKEIIPLPPTTPFIVYSYSQSDVREPFELPLEAVVQSQPKVKKDCWQPSQRANKSPLERFALRQLEFKGVIGSGSKVSALIAMPEGKLTYVNKGQYIGNNHGRVSEIAQQHLLIKETLPDGLGCWTQRSIKLTLK